MSHAIRQGENTNLLIKVLDRLLINGSGTLRPVGPSRELQRVLLSGARFIPKNVEFTHLIDQSSRKLVIPFLVVSMVISSVRSKGGKIEHHCTLIEDAEDPVE